MEESVRSQMNERYAALTAKIQNPAISQDDLGEAFGEMGKLFLATEYLDSAEVSLLNAQSLMPSDPRWPYYLARLYNDNNNLEKSAASFEKVLELQPSDAAALLWSGNVYLELGRSSSARLQFEKALSVRPDGAAALFGLGRAALAVQDYQRAVDYLEQALKQEPSASSIHYPLAMAYRGLKKIDKAEAHLKLNGDVQVSLPDPRMRELGELLQSTLAYELRGDRALNARDFQAAVAYFQKAIELAPNDPGARQKLGSALFLTGDVRGALAQFEEAARISPTFAKAQYSIGVLLASNGRHREAIERFSAAVKDDPKYLEARLALADALRRQGQVQEALRHYAEVVKADPKIGEAWFGYAMGLVRLRRYAEARDWLAEGVRVQPAQVDLAHALARLLAAAPDDRVRDGQRALSIMEGVIKTSRTIDVGETMAMALAELGRYREAADWQRDAIAAAEAGGQRDLARRMADNLHLYSRHEPCRTPWRADDPVNAPGLEPSLAPAPKR
jgi:tetratricopeptide (TPR) repeat protein